MAERSEVKGFLQNVLGLCDPALVELLGERMTVIHAKKGDVLQKRGMPVNEIYFLNSGLVRGYYTDANGNDATDCFVVVPGAPARRGAAGYGGRKRPGPPGLLPRSSPAPPPAPPCTPGWPWPGR